MFLSKQDTQNRLTDRPKRLPNQMKTAMFLIFFPSNEQFKDRAAKSSEIVEAIQGQKKVGGSFKFIMTLIQLIFKNL